MAAKNILLKNMLCCFLGTGSSALWHRPLRRIPFIVVINDLADCKRNYTTILI